MNTSVGEYPYRAIMGRYPTGVTAITAMSAEQKPIGMVVGTFTSVSIDPPLVAFLPDRTSSSYARLREASSLCANMLSAEQEAVCRAFAVKGAQDKFAGLDFNLSPAGNPVIDGSVGWVDFSIENIVEAGDHDIVIGRVSGMGEGNGGLPLLFLGGGYGGFTPHSRVIPATTDIMRQLRFADVARSELQVIADRLGLECSIVAPVEDSVVRVASAGSIAAHAPRPAHVGLRLPFEAPMGALFVAWAGESVQERWVRRAKHNASDAEVESYLRGLDVVRERGWTLSLQTSAFERMDASIAESATSNQRAFEISDMHLALDGANAFAPPVDLSDGQTYRVRNLSVPVRLGNRVLMYLTVFGFGEQVTSQVLREAIEVLTEAADRIAGKGAEFFEEENDA